MILQNFELIQRMLKDTFEVSRMKLQLFEYLSLNENELNIIKVGSGFNVLAYNKSLCKSEPYMITLNDGLTIYSYHVIDNIEIGFECHVSVALGNYKKEIQLFSTDKCIGVFKYNGDLNLVDINFFIEECFKP